MVVMEVLLVVSLKMLHLLLCKDNSILSPILPARLAKHSVGMIDRPEPTAYFLCSLSSYDYKLHFHQFSLQDKKLLIISTRLTSIQIEAYVSKWYGFLLCLCIALKLIIVVIDNRSSLTVLRIINPLSYRMIIFTTIM